MHKWMILLVVTIAFCSHGYGIDRLYVTDHPSDDGTGLDLSWTINPIYNSVVLQKADSLANWATLAGLTNQDSTYIDKDDITPGKTISYRIIAKQAAKPDSLVLYSDGIAREQWFNYYKLPLLLLLIAVCSAVSYYIYSARRGADLFIRRINGLDSMDEAVGRATEKGKPILFVPGIGDLDDMQTIAGLTILSQLAYKAATYNARLLVPVSKSMVLSTAREVVKDAFYKAERPDEYNPDCVFYLTDDQFGYVAGIDGIMLREQPAANFYLGTFYAEALILAETGFGTGAMQTSGTAMPSQLPFFVVACDYTLIGEELFAASAYLSKEANQLGSLKGQDFGKLIVVFLIIIGCLLEISGIHYLKQILMLE